MTSLRLDERVSTAADRVVTTFSTVPGLVVGIAMEGESAVSARGPADLVTGEPMARDTLHDLASVSKLLTTTAVMRLIDAGALSLETTVGEMLGDGPIAERTVRMLLEHRGGLVPWWPLYLDPAAAHDPIRAALELAPATAPDVRRVYSDIGFITLGAVVARAGGAPFPAVIRREVIGPLGLTGVRAGPVVSAERTAASGDGDAIERSMVASGVPYPVPLSGDEFDWRTGALRGEIADGNSFHAFSEPTGHAGWFATIDDLLIMGTAFVSDPDSHGLWSRTTLDRFLSAGPDPEQALGFRRYPAGSVHPTRTLWGHPGFTGTALAFGSFDGHPPLAIALAANRLHGDPAPTRTQLIPTEQLLTAATTAAFDPSEIS